MAKTIKIQGTFEVINSNQLSETKKTLQQQADVSKVTTVSPTNIAGSTTNSQLPNGSITLIKQVHLRTSQEVTLKIGQSSDTGFKFGPGDGFWCCQSGFAGVWVTTGPNATDVEAVLGGD